MRDREERRPSDMLHGTHECAESPENAGCTLARGDRQSAGDLEEVENVRVGVHTTCLDSLSTGGWWL